MQALLALLVIHYPYASQAQGVSPPSCEPYASFLTNYMVIQSNAWNKDVGKGKQCLELLSFDAKSVSWQVNWTWADNPQDTKSFPNAVVYPVTPRRLYQLDSITTTWKYSYSGTDLKANVAYDMFTSRLPNGRREFEIMIWYGLYGDASPLKEDYSSSSRPLLEGIAIAGNTWQLWRGHNMDATAYAFLASDASKQDNSITVDLLDFVRYLTEHMDVPADHYWLSIGAGTETYIGTNAIFTTEEYSINVAYDLTQTVESSGMSHIAGTSTAKTVTLSKTSNTSPDAKDGTSVTELTGVAPPLPSDTLTPNIGSHSSPSSSLMVVIALPLLVSFII